MFSQHCEMSPTKCFTKVSLYCQCFIIGLWYSVFDRVIVVNISGGNFVVIFHNIAPDKVIHDYSKVIAHVTT